MTYTQRLEWLRSDFHREVPDVEEMALRQFAHDEIAEFIRDEARAAFTDAEVEDLVNAWLDRRTPARYPAVTT